MKGNKIFDFSRKGFQDIINIMTKKINECVDVSNEMARVVNVPSSSTDNGAKGYIAIDSNYIYICYDTNKWLRVSKDLTSW